MYNLMLHIYIYYLNTIFCLSAIHKFHPKAFFNVSFYKRIHSTYLELAKFVFWFFFFKLYNSDE